MSWGNNCHLFLRIQMCCFAILIILIIIYIFSKNAAIGIMALTCISILGVVVSIANILCYGFAFTSETCSKSVDVNSKLL